MSRVALVRNPISTANLKGAAAEVPAGVTLICVDHPEDLTGALQAAHDTGAQTVLIDGGDGTVREVLSRLPEIWGTALPPVAILPRGNTNLIARETGGVAPDRLSELVTRLTEGPAPHECRRALLRADRAGEPPLRGFILGWGAYAEGTRVAREEISARGSGQVARAVFSILRRTLFGARRRHLRQGVPTGLQIDDGAMGDAPRLLGLVTTLQDPLVAGFNPFWGDGPGPIRWLDVSAPGRRLALAAPFLATGRPRAWMQEAGYRSGRATNISLTLDTGFVMDGELFQAPVSGPLDLSATEEVVFLSL